MSKPAHRPKGRKNLSQLEADAIAQLIYSGLLTYDQIAEQLNVGKATVCKVAVERGLRRQRGAGSPAAKKAVTNGNV